MTPEQAVRENVPRLRKQRGLTQPALSRKLGWSKQTVSDLESGKRHIRLDDGMALAHVLEVAPVHLFTPWGEKDAYEVESRNLGVAMSAAEARFWVMGVRIPPMVGHPRRYFSAVPDWWWDIAAATYETFKRLVGDRFGDLWSWSEEGPYEMTYGRDLTDEEQEQVRQEMTRRRQRRQEEEGA